MKQTLRGAVFVFSIGMAMSATASDATASEVGGPLPPKLADYELTGETETCLPQHRIKQTIPIDNRHIVFRLNNGERYVSRLGGTCSGLRSGGAITYTVGPPKLCNTDIIRVLDPASNGVRSTCGLGVFEKLQTRSTDGGA